MFVSLIDDALLKKSARVHFIGVGGSGMFPIVQILKSEGHIISGSDNNETDTTAFEREIGVTVCLGQSAENIKGADLIVYSAAIMPDNPELIAAKESPIPAAERSTVLGLLSARYENAVCVSGTHGKTTASSMITQILLDGDFDPTVVIGGKLPALHGSGRAGKSGIMVVEACEFVDTFLKLSPAVAVILNIDEDHLDYFKNLRNIQKSFRKFAGLASKAVILNGDDKNTLETIEGLDKEKITFGFGAHNDYYPQNIEILSRQGASRTSFEVWRRGEFLFEAKLRIPGRHNILNALAAAAAAIYVGASPEQVRQGLYNFTGAKRRFEVLGKVNGFTVADDYAHHPAELEVTLKAALTMGYNKIWAVFQPFTFSRTAILLDDFARVLRLADKVLLTQIMGSREKNTYGIYSSDLAEKIPGALVFDSFEQIRDYALENAGEGDLLITMGCGDIYKAAKLILAEGQHFY
ncbi:MAG: UDP-N-acetylmuramate--L-alanine ligase [Oscillospiraceae bacterium]|jgi:UDP-N-acetylmuramate--alanine ligase|nr:UDP-N-acetylmuramate--L-alanine ligase [Oscillospiraceae bacterium]